MKKIKIEKVKLNPEPRRGDLTVREMVSILGGLIGSLCENATPADVRDAVTWWATTDAAWLVFGGDISSNIHEAIKKRLDKGSLAAKTLGDLVTDIVMKEK